MPGLSIAGFATGAALAPVERHSAEPVAGEPVDPAAEEDHHGDEDAVDGGVVEQLPADAENERTAAIPARMTRRSTGSWRAPRTPPANRRASP